MVVNDKIIRSVYIEKELYEQAKELGINISDELNKFLMISIGEARKEKELPPEVIKELDNWIEDIKASSNINRWQGFLIGRCRLIRNRTGIDLSPDQLETEVNKRLQDAEHNNDNAA